jgi:hypothetical protein
VSKNFELTEETYYTIEADREYCSASQIKQFSQCEARAMAILDGTYEQEKSDALIFGSLVDALWENGGNLEEYSKDHPELFSSRGATKGQLLAKYQKAVQCFDRTKQDALFSEFMSGDKQSIFVGEIDGMPFKAKLDSYHNGKCIVDLKTTKSIRQAFFEPDTGYVSFIEKFGYHCQLAIYQELVYQNTGERLPCFIAAVSKEEEPDIEVIYIDDDKLREGLEEVKKAIPNIRRLKAGEIAPIRCENCAYCRRTKKLTKAIHFSELILDGTS